MSPFTGWGRAGWGHVWKRGSRHRLSVCGVSPSSAEFGEGPCFHGGPGVLPGFPAAGDGAALPGGPWAACSHQAAL